LPFAGDDSTPAGTVDGDDDDFVLLARCTIVITEADDYTFGFSSSDGARLRIEGTAFIASTRLNPDNPSNPAHSGNTLSFSNVTSNSDTLGVCQLAQGVYEIEFLTWERSGAAYAEVFAARGAKTAVDESFRLVGHRPAGLVGDNIRIAAPGWRVWLRRNNTQNLNAALTSIYDAWSTGVPVAGLRFTSADSAPEHDPVTFFLEGTRGGAATGPWERVATGSTGLSTTRLASGPAIFFPAATVPYIAYRLTFPTIRNAAGADSMQIAEIQFLDGSGMDLSSPDEAIIPTSPNSPSQETAVRAIDDDASTKYSNFDKLNAGFVITPRAQNVPVINFHDPQAGGGGHGFPQTAFPGDSPGDDNNFALGARATMTIPAAADYTFCLASDDGARLRIKGSRGWSVRSPAAGASLPQALPDGMLLNGCCGDTFGTVHLEAGTHEVELVYNEMSGGSYAGLWSALGRHTGFSLAHFSLLGSNERTTVPDSVPFSLLAPTDASPPRNNHFAGGFTIPGRVAHVAGCNTGATLEPDEPRQLLWEKSVWWNWLAPATGAVQVDTAGSEFDTVLAVYTGNTMNTLTLVAANDDETPLRTSKLLFLGVAGNVYHIQAGGFGGEAGHLRLHLAPPDPGAAAPANDDFSSPANLGSDTSFAVSGNTTAATAELTEPDHWPSNPANALASVWFIWTAPYSGDFIMDTVGSRFDTVLAVYTGNEVEALTLVAADDQGPGVGDQSRLRFSAASGVTYHIAVDGYAATASRGDYVLGMIPVPGITGTAVATAGTSRTCSLTWRSEPFATYHIEQSVNLRAWSTAAACFASHGFETNIDLPGLSVSTPRVFFRVLRD
jgi:hypothetical protein